MVAPNTYYAIQGKDVTFEDVVATTVTATITGNITGNVTGNVTGDVTGDVTGGIKRPVQVITGDGAITIRDGVVILTKGSAAAITLAAPTAGTHDGIRIDIIAGSAQAHVVTVTGMAAGSGQDVGTFGGAINDICSLIAYNAGWYILTAPRNVTFA